MIVELGFDVEEVTQSGLYDDALDPGDLVLTGGTQGDDGLPAMEAYVLPVHITDLSVEAGAGTMFGHGYPGTSPWTGDYDELGETIQETDSGFVVCGWSKGNLKHAVTPDVVDMYLIRTEAYGRTYCDEYWDPDTAIVAWPDSCLLPAVYDSSSVVAVTPEYDTLDTDHSVCIPDDATPPTGSRPASCMCRIVPGDRPSRNPGEESVVRLRPLRNPLPRGEVLYVTTSPLVGDRVQAEVFDARGTCIVRQHIGLVAGGDIIPIASSSLPAGAYSLIIHDGTLRIMGRFIVAQ